MSPIKDQVEPAWATHPASQEFKNILTNIGRLCPQVLIQCIDSTIHYLEVGRWMRANGFKFPKKVRDRNEIFRYVAERTADHQLLYLEFGVYRGKTILEFARMVTRSDSLFHGFDSFVGLPERWNIFNKAQHFSTEGEIPTTSDTRVSFFKGWFNEVLPTYSLPKHEQLFINIDSDLYSSASQVLKALTPSIQIGTYIYFDEFYDRNNEKKAFEEFIEATGFKFECLLSTKALVNVLFRRIS